jgi:hypothetical protein
MHRPHTYSQPDPGLRLPANRYGAFSKNKMKILGVCFIIVLISCSNLSNEAEGKISNQTNSEKNKESNSDSTFQDFILQFGFDYKFQQQRILFPIVVEKFGIKTTVEKGSWKNDRLFVDLEAITDVSNGIRVNENSIERIFSWTNVKSGARKNYYFKKQSGEWFLFKIEYEKYLIPKNGEDFYLFLSRFCTDSVFQKQRIQFPLDVKCLDDDYNEKQEKRIEDKWRFRGFYYECDSIATLFYDFNRTFEDTDDRILEINGVENGVDIKCTFKRLKNHWVLIKLEDYST